METVTKWLKEEISNPQKLTWNKVYTKLMEAVEIGPHNRKAVVFYLERLSETKSLSFGERKLKSYAENYDEYHKNVIQLFKNSKPISGETGNEKSTGH